MSQPDSVEVAFDLLAQALDRLPAGRRGSFLSALALALAAKLADTDALADAIAQAERACGHD